MRMSAGPADGPGPGCPVRGTDGAGVRAGPEEGTVEMTDAINQVRSDDAALRQVALGRLKKLANSRAAG